MTAIDTRFQRIVCLVCCLLFVGGACARRDMPQARRAAAAPAVSPKMESSVPTREECEAFVAAIREGFFSGDTGTIDRLIAWDEVIERASRGLELSDQYKREFTFGVKQSLADSGLGRQVAEAVADGGSYYLLRIHKVDGQQRAMFRLVAPEGGVNYHDMILEKTDDGQVRAVDLFIFMTGELISETFRRNLVPLAAHESRSLLEKLTGQENDLVKSLTQLEQIPQHMQNGRFREALETIDTLPASVQAMKHIGIMRIMVAQQVGDEAFYADAIRRFRDQHPDDPTVDLAMLDGLILAGQIAEALQSIDRLEDSVGGDPFLDVLRSGVYFDSGQLDKAKQAAQEAIDEGLDLVDPYWNLVSVSLDQEDYHETARLLMVVEQRFQLEMLDLTTVPEYAGFVNSPAYRQWLDRPTRPVVDDFDQAEPENGKDTR